MQLVAYGAQDIYLTGNPQITFFKVVYRRHTNFSMELIEQTFNGSVTSDGRVTSTISRNGDLIHRMYLNFDPGKYLTPQTGTAPADGTDLFYVGFALFKTLELEIGGQKIDKLYDHWLSTQHELFTPNKTKHMGTYQNSTGDFIGGRGTNEQNMSFLNRVSITGEEDLSAATHSEHSAWVPLPFWFCRNVGLALPLIALQYHEVKLIIELCSDTKHDLNFPVRNTDLKLWTEYIYLDTDERRRFAQVSHEYLIEQLQFQESTPGSSIDLNFNHPVKELIFTSQDIGQFSHLPMALYMDANGGGVYPNLRTKSQGEGTAIGLKLNGHERFAPQHLDYFTRTQVYQHHSGNGGVVNGDSIGVYSFALKPEEHQPSGTCNFSRIDSAQLTISGTLPSTLDQLINVYAVNYNVLRIMSGMGGLAYSN